MKAIVEPLQEWAPSSAWAPRDSSAWRRVHAAVSSGDVVTSTNKVDAFRWVLWVRRQLSSFCARARVPPLMEIWTSPREIWPSTPPQTGSSDVGDLIQGHPASILALVIEKSEILHFGRYTAVKKFSFLSKTCVSPPRGLVTLQGPPTFYSFLPI